MQVKLLFTIAFAAIVSCAPTEQAIPPITKEVFRAQENSEKALKLASVDSARITNLNLKLDLLSKRMELLDSFIVAVPLTLPQENQVHMALLREEIFILRKFIEKQDSILVLKFLRGPLPSKNDSLPLEYEVAKDFLRENEFPKAAALFEETAVKYSDVKTNNRYSNLVSDSWYWNGEAHMAMGNYAQAISAFQKVFSDLKSRKTADADYQIAVCLMRMGKREHAQNAFRRVVEFYPQSPRAAQAKIELNKIK